MIRKINTKYELCWVGLERKDRYGGSTPAIDPTPMATLFLTWLYRILRDHSGFQEVWHRRDIVYFLDGTVDDTYGMETQIYSCNLVRNVLLFLKYCLSSWVSTSSMSVSSYRKIIAAIIIRAFATRSIVLDGNFCTSLYRTKWYIDHHRPYLPIPKIYTYEKGRTDDKTKEKYTCEVKYGQIAP